MIDDILEFWFADRAADDATIAHRQNDLWWGKDDAVDADIARRFGTALGKAARGELESWGETAHGRLALVILLDQFPRHIHRGTPEAFAHDRIALAHSLEAQTRGQDRELRPVERVFLYMPMQHAEALMAQDESVRRFEALAAEVPPEQSEPFRRFADFSRRHRDIVLRFDRFPHRNAVLGRRSTPEEAAFLDQPGSTF